jgi:adenine specific DNA methylase Mod
MDHINKLILGDNLEMLRKLKSETIDQGYLGLPFFPNRNYEVIWDDEGKMRNFYDQLSEGLYMYINWLKERLEQMHHMLKPTGIIFVHCDQNANAYMKVEILDKLFGRDNLQNCIFWQPTTLYNKTKKLSNIHDAIYWFSKTGKKTFNSVFESYSDARISRYKLQGVNGRYRTENLTAAHYSITQTIEWC